MKETSEFICYKLTSIRKRTNRYVTENDDDLQRKIYTLTKKVKKYELTTTATTKNVRCFRWEKIITHNFVLKGALIISITEHLLYITNEKMLAVGTVEEHSSGNSSTHTTIQYRRRAAKKCTSQRMIEITNFLCKTNYYWWISVFMWRRDGIGFYAQTYINEYKWMRCHAKCDRIVKICEPKHSLNYMWSRLAIRFGFSHSHNSFGSTHTQQIIVSNHNTSLQYCMTARCVCVCGCCFSL